MRSLPLYTEAPTVAIERASRLDIDPKCVRCALSSKVKSVCISPEGDPGGLLVVSDYPAVEEDRLNRFFVGAMGRYLRARIAERWKGPVVFGNALGCAPGARKLTEKMVDACRPYLAQTLDEAQPKRILALGSTAIYSLTGRKPPPMSIPKGYGWTSTLTPIFMFHNPVLCLKNDLIKKEFEKNLTWALSTPINGLLKDVIWDAQALILETEADAQEAYEDLRRAEWISYDNETAGLLFETDGADRYGHHVVSLSMAAAYKNDAYVWSEKALKDKRARKILKSIMQDPTFLKVGQNEKFDHHSQYSDPNLRFTVRGLHADTRLQRRLIDSSAAADLETMQELVGAGGGKEAMNAALKEAIKLAKKRNADDAYLATVGPLKLVKAVRDAEKPKTYAYGLVHARDPDLLYRYNAIDARTSALIAQRQLAELKEEPILESTYATLVRPANEAVKQIERWGVPIDLKALEDFDNKLSEMIDELEDKLELLAPGVNFGSTPQLQVLLYETLRFRPPHTTPTGKPSTDEAALKILGPKDKSGIIDALLQHRSLTKMRGTYAHGLRKHVRSDGRIHPTIHLDGTESGRASSANPNLQNIPRVDQNDPLTILIRNVFAAKKGRKLVEIDYSTVELRVACELSKDPEMRKIFLSGEDYHLRTAKLIAPAFGERPENVNKEHRLRNMAKIVNFGILYGKGTASLARELNITISESEKLYKLIIGTFKVLRKWCLAQVQEARKTGYTWTYWRGQKFRRRPLLDIASKEEFRKAEAERAAVNTPIQGSSSDYLEHSMIEAVNWILEDKIPAMLLMPIHDSLWFEVDDDYVEILARKVSGIMKSQPTELVPLDVDVKVGQRWGEMQKLKF